MSWESLTGHGIAYQASEADSRRFGLSVARVTVGWDHDNAAAELTEVLRDAPEDLLIVRWPSHDLTLGSAAARSGRVLIPADVLTYWESPAGRMDDRAARASSSETELTCTPASAYPGDPRAAITAIVEDSFAAYGNHYRANPALDPGLALQGYVEWATNTWAQNPDDVLILAHGGEAVGVATLAQDSTGQDLEILLAGIVSGHQSKGWYGTLLEAVDRAAVERSCARVIISTQAHNVRVQRAWARLGMRPFAAITTVHAVRALV